MDKLTREAQEHEEIFEEVVLFKKSLSLFRCGKAENCFEKIRKFFSDYMVEHFQFEEKKIFPLILDAGTLEEKQLIRQLQQEHIEALGQLDRINDLILKSESGINKSRTDELLKTSEQLIAMTLKHARKEDTQLFPVLKKYKVHLK